MAKISGHGGFLVKATSPTAGTRFENSSYDFEAESVNDDVTTSGSNGWVEGLPVVLRLTSLTIEVPDDDAVTFALAIGITEGAVLSFWLKRGAAASWNKIDDTIVQRVRTSNPQTGARRLSIMCEFGRLTRNVSAPTLS